MSYYILNSVKLFTTRKAQLSTKRKPSNTQEDAKSDLDILNKLAFGDFKTIEFPIQLYNIRGNNYGEIIATSNLILLIVNQRFKNIVEINELSGCDFFNVKINNNDTQDTTYYGWAITGKTSSPDWDKCEIIKKSRKLGLPEIRLKKGFILQNNDVLTKDFAIAKNTGFRLISQKAKDILEKAKFKNLEFINSEEFEILESSVKSK